jgi:hypothetical protein
MKKVDTGQNRQSQIRPKAIGQNFLIKYFNFVSIFGPISCEIAEIA